MAAIAAAAIAVGGSLFASSQSSKASKAASDAQLQAAALQTLVARELHDHWKAYYQTCDAAFAQEICAIPVYVPQYEQVAARARLTVLAQFGRARQQLLRCQDVFCVGTYLQNCNFISGVEAQALADAVNFGYRREENLKIQLDQMRLDNIHRTLMGGRNLLDQTGAASRSAAAIGTQIGAQAGRAASGWMQFAGFLRSPEGQALVNRGAAAFSQFFGSNRPPGGTDAWASGGEFDPQTGNIPAIAPDSGGFADQSAGPAATGSTYPAGGTTNWGGTGAGGGWSDPTGSAEFT